MTFILLGAYLFLIGLFGLISVNIPGWVMSVFAIIVGLLLIWVGISKRPPPG